MSDIYLKNWFSVLVLLLCLPILALSQETISGNVFDVGTRTPITNVMVSTDQSAQSILTDESGFFSIESDSSGQSIADHFVVSDNQLQWILNEPTTINMYSVTGALLRSVNGEQAGTWRLPDLPAALYLLQVQSGQEAANIVLLYNGVSYALVKEEDSIAPTTVNNSELHFTKDGYFDRSSPIADPSVFEHYNMLKTEYDDLDYFNVLLRHEAFFMLHNTPANTHFSDIQSIKVLYGL